VRQRDDFPVGQHVVGEQLELTDRGALRLRSGQGLQQLGRPNTLAWSVSASAGTPATVGTVRSPRRSTRSSSAPVRPCSPARARHCSRNRSTSTVCFARRGLERRDLRRGRRATAVLTRVLKDLSAALGEVLDHAATDPLDVRRPALHRPPREPEALGDVAAQLGW
jgi:hypothetical protein